MTPEALEAAAKDARRRADIAKHKPLSLESLDKYGDEISRETSFASVSLMQLALDLQNAYGKELQKLWATIKTLRDEALYWRQKCQELEKLGS